MMVYIYMWKWLELGKLPLSKFMSLFIWNPLVAVIKVTCQKHCRFVYRKKTLSFTVHLIFIGPCIIIYSYSTTNKMHLLSQIIYSCKMLRMFRMVFLSIIRSSKLHIRQWYMSNSSR